MGISILQKTSQKRVVFRENNLDKIETQVSESVKILAISFKR